MSRVSFEKKQILIDGKPTPIRSGAVHYFRVPEQLWEDRLRKAVLCGLNCVETYFCWNLHEPEEGTFDFHGMLDLERFIRLAQSLGLYVIVRPGPYICAEWDNGGLPAWLMVKEGVEFRRMNRPYLDALENYYRAVLPKIVPLQYDKGGPIIAIQLENEYGSYGRDKVYLNHLRDLHLKAGCTVPLFTADGASDICINGGLLEGSPMALTFGSRGLDAFRLGRSYRPEDPAFCMEFWCGWFDAWGDSAPHTRQAADVANEYDDMLGDNGSVNLYMFHGGTNFNFWNGANGFPNGRYTPDTTSYDYDAPLSECGDATDKFFAIQNVIKKHFPDARTGIPENSRKLDYGKIAFTATAPLFPNLDRIATKKVDSVSTKSMEALGQNFGFIHYRTHLDGPTKSANLLLWQTRDRAIGYLNGKQSFIYYRNDESNVVPPFQIPQEGMTLDLLVENMGRINYGPLTGRDFKGIVDGVTLGNQYQMNWEIRTLPMNPDDLDKLEYGPFAKNEEEPAFHKAVFELQDVADTFLRFPGVKGVVWVNGFNIGRYWNIGPGFTLYIPAPFLKKGTNEIVVFELETLKVPYLHFSDHPIRS